MKVDLYADAENLEPEEPIELVGMINRGNRSASQDDTDRSPMPRRASAVAGLQGCATPAPRMAAASGLRVSRQVLHLPS